MKGRIVKLSGMYQLLTCNGNIRRITDQELYAFFMNWDSPSYYEGPGKWDAEISMEDYAGETICSVGDDGSLNISKPEHLKLLLSTADCYVSSFEYAAMHGKQHGIIQRYCREGRIVGAIKVGKNWAIPKDAPYPDRAN